MNDQAKPKAPAKRKSRSKYASMRHAFLYKIVTGGGSKPTVHKAWAKVIHATKPVELTLTADHVLRAMGQHGVGNTSRCTMAVCTYEHAAAFPHAVEGHVDWNYTRCFVVSKVDKMGFPSECYCYEHNDDIARLNDTAGGQKELLRRLRNEGPRTVRLNPTRYRSEEKRPGRDRKSTGKRNPINSLKGADLRYAVYKLGVEPEPA